MPVSDKRVSRDPHVNILDRAAIRIAAANVIEVKKARVHGLCIHPTLAASRQFRITTIRVILK